MAEWHAKEVPRSRELRRWKTNGGDQPQRELVQPDFYRQGAEERRLRRHQPLGGSAEQLCWVVARCGSGAERTVETHSFRPVQAGAEAEEAGLS